MTEEEKNEETREEPAPEEGELLSEMERLGRELGRSLQDAWDSDERKELESELTRGLDAAGKQITRMAREASETEAAQEIKQGASSVGREIHQGLLSGLRLLNRELSKDRSKPDRSDGDDGDKED